MSIGCPQNKTGPVNSVDRPGCVTRLTRRYGKYSQGFTGPCPALTNSKCSAGPTMFPVLPVAPMAWPASTACPHATCRLCFSAGALGSHPEQRRPPS